MLARFGVDGIGVIVGDGGFKPVSHQPIVGGVVVDAIGLRLELRPGRDDVHVLRLLALHSRHQVGVERQLENSAALGFAGQLGVCDLVRPIAELAGRIHAHQDVSPAAPASIGQRALHDDVAPVAHGLDGSRHSRVVRAYAVHRRHLAACSFQVLDVGSFVRQPALYQLFQRRVVARRRGTHSEHHVVVELRKASASQVVHEVAGAQLQGVVGGVHG